MTNDTIIKAEGRYWSNKTGNWAPVPEASISGGEYLERLSDDRIREIEAIIRSLPVEKTGDMWADWFSAPSDDACRAAIGPDYDTWGAFLDFDQATIETYQTSQNSKTRPGRS